MSYVIRDPAEKESYRKALAAELFNSQEQLWVPFLGAGVSASGKPSTSVSAREVRPEIDAALKYLSDKLDLSLRSLFFIRCSLELALELEELSRQASADIQNTLKNQAHVPTAAELIELFRTGSGFEWPAADLSQHLGFTDSALVDGQKVTDTARALLDRIAPLAGVFAPPLPVTAACYELFHGRDRLLRELLNVMSNKSHVTNTHRLIARVAKHHVSSNKGQFLIITTNYDSLMEEALKEGPPEEGPPKDPLKEGPPYVVLSTNNRDFQVKARFGNMKEDLRKEFEALNQPRSPKNYILKTPPSDQVGPLNPLIVIYKLHGCINELQECPLIKGKPEKACSHDGIILSDEDYLRSIAHLADNDGVIPVSVRSLLDEKRLLFLGYSLGDWNVRGLLRAFRNLENENDERPARKPDLAVARRLSALEQRFYEGNQINVIVEDLNTFSPRLEDWATANVV